MFFFPIQKQLEFVCKKCSDFAPSKYPIQKALFTFSASQLIEYIKEHEEICELLMSQSDDKRYTPSTIITPTKNNFIVGRFNSRLEFEFYEIQSFDNSIEAAADYVLMNWKSPRLRPPQTERRLKRQFGENTLFFLDEDNKIFDATHGRFKYYDGTKKDFIYYD
jgi:hypothetical protein